MKPTASSGPSSPALAATILAGGSGTRFWPLSTAERPKQFLNLFGNRSMLQQTFDRLQGLVPPDRVLVLTNDRFVETVREQLPELPPQNVIGEPIPRDTSAAVVVGAAVSRHRFGNPAMLVLPADHVISPVSAFQAAVRSAAHEAWTSSSLYTFGIGPTYPATGYGYLEAGEPCGATDDIPHFQLQRFKEKPDVATAEEYLRTGGFYWNSGMFVWRTDTIIGEVERQLPEHAARLLPVGDFDGGPVSQRRLRSALEPLPKVSIDFGVMENAASVRMVVAPFSWNDVGGWNAMEDYLTEDGEGNSVQGRVHSTGASDNLVYCESDDDTVALVGVSDLVVVRAGNRTLVARKDKLEEIKRLVQMME